jgi:hypothetical protein
MIRVNRNNIIQFATEKEQKTWGITVSYGMSSTIATLPHEFHE